MHTGRNSWFRTKDGIFRPEFLIGIRKIEIPETVDDIPCGTCNGVRFRIKFTKISNNKVLVVSMTATVNR